MLTRNESIRSMVHSLDWLSWLNERMIIASRMGERCSLITTLYEHLGRMIGTSEVVDEPALKADVHQLVLVAIKKEWLYLRDELDEFERCWIVR